MFVETILGLGLALLCGLVLHHHVLYPGLMRLLARFVGPADIPPPGRHGPG